MTRADYIAAVEAIYIRYAGDEGLQFVREHFAAHDRYLHTTLGNWRCRGAAAAADRVAHDTAASRDFLEGHRH